MRITNGPPNRTMKNILQQLSISNAPLISTLASSLSRKKMKVRKKKEILALFPHFRDGIS